MPGHQASICDTPPSHPKWCVLCMLSAGQNDIEWFIDTGAVTEDGVVYFCNRCFVSLVGVTELFIDKETHTAELKKIAAKYQEVETSYNTYLNQDEILFNKFGFRLVDVANLNDINNRINELSARENELNEQIQARKASELLLQRDFENERALLALLGNQIEEKRQELDHWLTESITTKLERIGRPDLIPIILNDQLPTELTRASYGDQREVDEPSGESDSPSNDDSPLAGIAF